MFHSARAVLSFRALPIAGGAAASAVVAQRGRRQEAPAARCEPIDFASAGLGAGVAVAAIAIMRMGNKDKGPPKFEARLRTAYTESKIARAVLAESGAGHADLVKASLAEQKDIKDPALAVANHVRELWAQLLAEAFHFPKSFFISTTTPMGGMDTGNNRRTLPSQKLGTYKLSIPSLKVNKLAVKWGIDKLAEKFDRNNDGVLDYHEFATLVLMQADFYAEQNGHAKRSKTEVLQLLYTVLDDDGDQLVTREEFESFIVMASKLGISKKHDDKLHADLWKQYDADGNGVLSYAEFLVFAKEMLDLDQFPGDFPN